MVACFSLVIKDDLDQWGSDRDSAVTRAVSRPLRDGEDCMT